MRGVLKGPLTRRKEIKTVYGNFVIMERSFYYNGHLDWSVKSNVARCRCCVIRLPGNCTL